MENLAEKIAEKRLIDSKHVIRHLHVKQHGLKVMADHDVRESPEGQDIESSRQNSPMYKTIKTIHINLAYPCHLTIQRGLEEQIQARPSVVKG